MEPGISAAVKSLNYLILMALPPEKCKQTVSSYIIASVLMLTMSKSGLRGARVTLLSAH